VHIQVRSISTTTGLGVLYLGYRMTHKPQTGIANYLGFISLVAAGFTTRVEKTWQHGEQGEKDQS